MSDNSKIEWTDATWNPVTGCTKVSPGCDHCYAETFAERFRGTPGHYFENGFEVQLRPERLEQPLRWRKPRRIFVNSMSDLFHQDVPDEYIAKVFAVMALSQQHTFQVLTKRHGRMRSLLNSGRWLAEVAANIDDLGDDPTTFGYPLPNVWLGVSVENQQWADIRIPALLNTPASVRFLSCEPLLGPVRITPWLTRIGPCDLCEGEGSIPVLGSAGEFLGGQQCPDCEFDYRGGQLDGIDWVIVGGESGRDARPMNPEWVQSLRRQCQAAAVPFLFKQWGEWAPVWNLRSPKAIPPGPTVRAEHLFHTPQGVLRMHMVGKRAAGRELDGRTWDEFPA